MARIVLTGAAGLIGQAMIGELSPRHELVLIDRRPVSGAGRPGIRADLARGLRWPAWVPMRFNRPAPWTRTFSGAAAVLHLAANRSPKASWASVLRNNIQATWNVLDAARTHRVPRVVCASSHHAAWGWDPDFSERAARDESGNLGDVVLAQGPRPVSPYGLSKAWVELAGRLFVEAGWIPTVIAVRIGTYAPAPPRDDSPPFRWVMPRDLHWLLSRCLEVEISGFHVIYGVTSRPGSLGSPVRNAQLLGSRSPV